MFKVGDKVVCINPTKNTILDGIYTIKSIHINPRTKLRYYLKICGLNGAYRIDRFISLIGVRKLKINKLFQKYEYKNL